MNIELLEKRLGYVHEQAISKYSKTGVVDVSNICKEIDDLLSGAEDWQRLFKENISDEEFYKILTGMAFIMDWDEQDFLNIVRKYYGKKFVGSKTIETKMQKTVLRTGDRCNALGKFDSWYEDVGINFIILYTEDANVSSAHIYSADEIRELIENNKIVLVTEKERKLFDSDKGKEEYQIFDCAYHKEYSLRNFLDENSKFYSSTLKYIRERLTTEKLKQLLDRNIQHINSEISQIIDCGEESIPKEHIASECYIEFEAREYTRRLKKLNEENKQ